MIEMVTLAVYNRIGIVGLGITRISVVVESESTKDIPTGRLGEFS